MYHRTYSSAFAMPSILDDHPTGDVVDALLHLPVQHVMPTTRIATKLPESSHYVEDSTFFAFKNTLQYVEMIRGIICLVEVPILLTEINIAMEEKTYITVFGNKTIQKTRLLEK